MGIRFIKLLFCYLSLYLHAVTVQQSSACLFRPRDKSKRCRCACVCSFLQFWLSSEGVHHLVKLNELRTAHEEDVPLVEDTVRQKAKAN
jgi:hypothetical protein